MYVSTDLLKGRKNYKFDSESCFYWESEEFPEYEKFAGDEENPILIRNKNYLEDYRLIW